MDINTIIQKLLHDVNWVGVLHETIIVSSFVVIIMILIEFVNLATKEKLSTLLNKNSYLQIIIGTLFGLIPGCMGTLIVAALYSERVISISTLIAAMIASVGDEAFFMLAVMPTESAYLFGILAILAIATGFTTEFIIRKRKKTSVPTNKKSIIAVSKCYDCTEETEEKEHHAHNSFSFKHITINRYKIIIVTILLAIVGLLATNTIGHNHASGEEHHGHSHDEQISECCHSESYHNEKTFYVTHNESSEGQVIKITLIIASLLGSILILFSSNHFVKNHIWKHIILKHFVKIIIWITLTLVVLNCLFQFIDINNWIEDNYFIMLLIAVTVGIIPQSGPHLIFISLFVQGVIPFPILLANSIVQDGHAGLPLLAENKKAFFLKKAIAVVLALLIGTIFWFV